jgi:hypothetical protein
MKGMAEDRKDAGGSAPPGAGGGAQAPRKPLPAAAQRALEEAAARRAAREREPKDAPKELHGPAGPDPARYGDWAVKGIASDF